MHPHASTSQRLGEGKEEGEIRFQGRALRSKAEAKITDCLVMISCSCLM